GGGGGEWNAREERDHVLGESTALEKAQQHYRAQERAAVVAAAAENEREPDEEALLRQEHVRLDVGEVVREEYPGEARHAGAERKSLHLEAEDRLAGNHGHERGPADRAQHPAERRAPQALERGVDEPDRGQHETQVEPLVVAAEPRVEGPRNRGDAVRPTREPGLVEQKQPEDLGEAQGDDGQVVL